MCCGSDCDRYSSSRFDELWMLDSRNDRNPLWPGPLCHRNGDREHPVVEPGRDLVWLDFGGQSHLPIERMGVALTAHVGAPNDLVVVPGSTDGQDVLVEGDVN